MPGTAEGSAALYSLVGSTIIPNTSGSITANELAAILNNIIASYPNTTDGLGGYTVLGTVTGGLWNGTPIGLAYGGTNAALSASLGGIFYSTASAGAVLAGTATAGQMLQSGANAAPSWTTTTWPATTGVNQLLWSMTANQIVGLATANGGVLNTSNSGVPSITAQPVLGVTGTQGTLTLNGSTSGSVTLSTPAIAGTGTNWTFPATNGSAGSIPTSDGAGNVSWTTGTYPATIAANSLLYASATNVVSALASANGGLLNTSAAGVPIVTPTPTLGVTGTISGKLTLRGSTSGSVGVTVPAIAGTSTNFSLPSSNGTANYVLQTDGAGNTSWTSPGLVVANAGTAIPFPQGRLTLTSGTPVLASLTLSGVATVYYTPYLGSSVPLWNGTVFVPTLVPEISNILANSSVGNAGPAAAVASSVYDLFVWNNGGTPVLTRGPVWTSTTARSAGTAIARVSGLLVNSISITNGPAAGYGTYVGTIATDASGATVSFARAPTLGQALLNVWNMYNRVVTAGLATDTNASYTYFTATLRQANAQTYNQIKIVAGLTEDDVTVTYNAQMKTAAAAGASGSINIGVNSITVGSAPAGFFQAQAAVVAVGVQTTTLVIQPAIGVTTFAALESGDGANTNTFNNASTNVLALSLRM